MFNYLPRDLTCMYNSTEKDFKEKGKIAKDTIKRGH